jgi:addiction module HigA family antidote
MPAIISPPPQAQRNADMPKKLAPIHPGEVLAEDFMAPRGLSANRLALDLHVPQTRLSEIIRGNRAISADTALRLGRYFETSAKLWMGIQADYDLAIAQDEHGARIAREVHVAHG